MYQGAVAGVPQYFSDQGHPVPPNYNPADWIMAVAQSTPEHELDEAGFFPSDVREEEKGLDPSDDNEGYLFGSTGRNSFLIRNPGKKFNDKQHISSATEVKLLFK